jgi:hypothetical protein
MKKKRNKLIINFLKGQGLGNQLWVYFSGLALSKILNCNLQFGNGKFFKGFFIVKNNLISKDYIVANKRYFIVESYDFFTDLEVTDYSKEIKKLKYLINLRDFELIGTLQNSNWIPSKKKILANLKFTKIKEDNSCAIHIRGGDYRNTIAKPSRTYFQSSLKYINDKVKKTFIVTDDENYSKKILKNIKISKNKKKKWDKFTNNHHFGAGIKADFFKIAAAKYNIISASTFSFWACYIGSLFINKKIIAPAFWFANRVSNSWSSPLNIHIKNWTYINRAGKITNVRNNKYFPKITSKKKQNKYFNFVLRKILNLYLDLK